MRLVYDATGRKWFKRGEFGVTGYASGIEYLDGKLEAIYAPDGRMVAEYTGGTITRYRAEYFHQDHLGNTRLVFSDFNQNGLIELTEEDPTTAINELEITQEAHYYPFGMNHLGSWYETVAPENKYLYNGKELNEDYEINLYEYGARWYDPAVGRFTGVDPIAEEFPWVSTYNYAENEPVANIDLHGLQKVRAVNEFKSRVAGATEAVGRKLEQGMGYVNAKYSQAKNAFWSVFGYEPPAGVTVATGEGEFAGRGPEDREGTSSAIIDGLPLPVGGGSGLKVWRNSQLESFENVANGLDKAVDAYNAYKDGKGGNSTATGNGSSVPYEIGATPDQTPTRPTKFGTDTVSVPAIIHYSNDSTSRGSVLFERSKSPNPRGGVVIGNSTKESIKPLFNLIKDKK